MAIEEVVAGQVFKGRRTSLRAGSASQVFARSGRRPKTKTLVTGLEAARASDMPSKSVGGRKPAGGFDSRPPPLLKWHFDQRRSAERGERRSREGPDPSPKDRVHHTSLSVFPPPRRRTSLPTHSRKTGQVFGRRPFEGEVGAAWPAPLGNRWRDLPSCWLLRPTPRPSQASCPHSLRCSSWGLQDASKPRATWLTVVLPNGGARYRLSA